MFCSGRPLFGRCQATQCTIVPTGASGSVTINARSFVDFGALAKRSGGDAFAPSHVKPSGMGWLLANAALVTLSFLTFAFADGESATAALACAATTNRAIATAAILHAPGRSEATV